MIWVPIEDGEEPQAYFRLIAFSSKHGQPLEVPDFFIYHENNSWRREQLHNPYKLYKRFYDCSNHRWLGIYPKNKIWWKNKNELNLHKNAFKN